MRVDGIPVQRSSGGQPVVERVGETAVVGETIDAEVISHDLSLTLSAPRTAESLENTRDSP